MYNNKKLIIWNKPHFWHGNCLLYGRVKGLFKKEGKIYFVNAYLTV
jgi:hypothetical protein